MRELKWTAFGFILLTGLLFGGWYVVKNLQVWSASINGQAVLAETEYSRQARVSEARAKAEAAELEGKAELTKAQFAAKANQALAEGLGGSEAYLRYLYIRMLEENQRNDVIYIPTEAGMPILEANRMAKRNLERIE